MKIAILGWGSLIWRPRNLAHDGHWRTDGPELPIEFARISRDRCLTLVLVPSAPRLSTLWTVSTSASLETAIANLAEREGPTPRENIGFVWREQGAFRCNAAPKEFSNLKRWLGLHDLDAVMWTDLSSNFATKTDRARSLENAIAYLKALPLAAASLAREYVEKAPAQVTTPLRRKIEKELGWIARA